MDDVFLDSVFSLLTEDDGGQQQQQRNRSSGGGGGFQNNNNRKRKKPLSLEEQVFTEADFDNNGGVALPPPIAEVVEWKYTMLPEDKIDMEARLIEDEREHINSATNYNCELCRIGDMAQESAAAISSMLQRVYQVEDRSYTCVPDRTRYESVARKYNETIWKKNESLGKRKMMLKQWTPAMVRHHFTVCEQSRPERQIRQDVNSLNQNITFLRYNGLYRQKIVNGEEKEVELDRSNHERWLKAMLTKASLLKTIDSLSTAKRRRGIFFCSFFFNFATRCR